MHRVNLLVKTNQIIEQATDFLCIRNMIQAPTVQGSHNARKNGEMHDYIIICMIELKKKLCSGPAYVPQQEAHSWS